MANEMIEIQQVVRRPLPTTRDVAAVLFRQWRTLLATFAAVAVLALISGLWARKYEAHMKVLVLRQRMDTAVSGEPNAPAQATPAVTEEELNSEVELLRSEDLLRKVVVATGLQHRGWSVFGRSDEDKRIALAVRKLSKDLHIDPVRKADVIAVSYQSSDPQLSAKVLNVLATDYMEKHREVHRASGEFIFFDQQTERFRHGLEESQARLADFTHENGVVSAGTERDLELQHLAEFDAAADQAQASAVETAQRIQFLQTQLATMHPRMTTQEKDTENQLLMQQLKSTLLNLELKRTELLTKYDPSYRLVQEVEKQIADTRSEIDAEENRPSKEETTDVDPTYAMLRSDLAKAQEDLTAYKARTDATRLVAADYLKTAERLQERALQQDDLEQTEKTQEENYLLYQKKREEARISDALDQRGILNVALAEQPIVPAIPVQSPVRAAGITLLLGFFASFGAAFAADYASPSFRTPDEVVGYLDMPVLASLPKMEER
ncbi:MAG: GumC family protein [Terracidiphilus sp.]